MKIAHLILAHTAPQQLERVIMRLAHPHADIYIHLDGKSAMGDFAHLAQLQNVFFIQNRVKVYWGTYNIVKATLHGFKEIATTTIDYQYVNLLSGQDYPLRPADHIHRYLESNSGTAFMNYLLFEPDWPDGLPRVQCYHFNNYRIPGKFILQSIANKLLPKRKLPYGFVAVGRSQWFTIPLSCVKYILEFWEGHSRFRRFIKLTWAPDEFLFQTILYNSEYKSSMKDEDLRYIDWSGGGVSPKTLSVDDAVQAIRSGKLFARKFDINKDAAALNLIDKFIENEGVPY